MVGFGISNEVIFCVVCENVLGVIIGSCFVILFYEEKNLEKVIICLKVILNLLFNDLR